MDRYIQKWYFEKHRYERVPNTYCLEIYYDVDEELLSKVVRCANCGSYIKFGDSYVSCQWQQEITFFGYAVCEDCHIVEWDMRKKHPLR